MRSIGRVVSVASEKKSGSSRLLIEQIDDQPLGGGDPSDGLNTVKRLCFWTTS